MSYLYTGSNSDNRIATGLSTQILVQVNGNTVGAIQELRPSQNRPLKRVGEIGTDGTVELVPHQITETSLNVTRIVFDRLRLPSAFSRQFVNIHAQRVPFDIFVFDRSNVASTAADGDVGDDSSGLVTHVYKNCWFKSLDTTYSAGDYVISESATIDCEFVNTFTGNGSSSIDGGLRGLSPDISGGNIEVLADAQGHRGSLDAVGLARLLAIPEG